MAGDNAIPKYTQASKDELQNSAGITGFDKDGGKWNQTINGLVVQGGKTSSSGEVTFGMKFQKQLLGIFVSAGTLSTESTTGFTASAACYWLAIGV